MTRARIDRVVRRVLDAARLAERAVAVTLVDDEEVRALNRRYRGMDAPTDVLSFAAGEGEPMPGSEELLGDVVISLERARAQAERYGHGVADEVAVLLAHGLLHLLGLDHERSAEEARLMAELEMSILDAAGVDPCLALVGRNLDVGAGRPGVG